MAVSTDTAKIEELLSRGVENIYPSRGFLESALKSGKQLTLYTGYDPTAPTLHIGNGVTLLKLRQFQELGHKVIMLIGDFTGMIGDPTDKSAARQRLTKKQVLENCKAYKKQAGRIINFSGKNAAQIKYNSKWLGKMALEDVVELGAHFTVQRMLERDMFEKRMQEEKPIYFHEFLYPLMQGYDSVAMDVDGEIGGNDQTFNMLAGRTLLKDLKNKEKFVLTTKLLVDSTGKKMSKSEGNMVAFADTAEDMFGKVMRWSDDLMQNAFELCTTVGTDEIKSILASANPRDAKLRLAFEITKTFLGEKAAQKGQENFASVIQNKERPDEIPELKTSDFNIVSVLVDSQLSSSRTEAKRAISQGGVYVNDVRVGESDFSMILKSGDIVKKGKRFFVKVV